MLFNSIEFLVFLPVVFSIYWLLKNNLRSQNLFVVLSSYIFYGWWDWRFLFLIIFTSLCSFFSGLLIEHFSEDQKKQKIVSAANIVINLSILGVFKYFNFFAENIELLFQSFGYQLDWMTLDIILPVGISFYTFQALSYTIDVYRKRIPATHDVLEFLAFISFFPQLVAGPIERATSLLPQFQKKREFDYTFSVDGLRIMLIGFFKKIVIADSAASLIDPVWSDIDGSSQMTLIIVAVLFSFQIYGDFSGYSDIAIGTARLFGINLRKNFNTPYLSKNLAEFWRRWHISLNTWFIDYVYIPLGGSKNGLIITIRNTFVVFLLSGLWHGANWTYICWGAYFALLFIPLLCLKRFEFGGEFMGKRVSSTFVDILKTFLTFIVVTIGWIFFRADSMNQAIHYLYRMFSYDGMNFQPFQTGDFPSVCIAVLFITILEIVRKDCDVIFFIPSRKRFIRWLGYLFVAMWIFRCFRVNQSFIYFQF